MNKLDTYRPARCITRLQKIKLLQAIEKRNIKQEYLSNFEGMDFYKSDEHFICEQDLQRYTIDEIEKISNDQILVSGPGTKLTKYDENNVITEIHLLPVSEDDKIYYLLEKQKK